MSKELEKLEEQIRFERFKKRAKIGLILGLAFLIVGLKHLF